MLNKVIYGFKQSQPAFGIKGKKWGSAVKFSTLYPENTKKIVDTLTGDTFGADNKIFIPAIKNVKLSKDGTKVRLIPKVPDSRELLAEAVRQVAKKLEIVLHDF